MKDLCFTALHKAAPSTPMHCHCVTVYQLFDLLKNCSTAQCYTIVVFAGRHAGMYIFLSTDTNNIFYISLSPSHFFASFFLIFLFLFFLTHPSHLVVCIVCPCLRFAPLYHLANASAFSILIPTPCNFWPLLPLEINSFLTPTLPYPILPTLFPPHCPPSLSPRLL